MVQGTFVSQRRLAACSVLVAVDRLCSLHGAGLLYEPAQVSCLLCACSCCLPVWLALVQGVVSACTGYTAAAGYGLAAVA